ncbi:two-component system response regulator [Scytonema hofmannii PCC 7110]|uniref:Two-component system response regulator n=1 Tax=Scytonema hofmannii PCC 7110 TaxID=128403 RepID=A0A139XES9_9CYAN|nr:response regulator [Scytonema hofmannii]KYC43181.1 two-component system response regulator [Scytonema hofmannii PCC 7110]
MKRILVVDDSATMRRMVIASLHELKEVNFNEANNGLAAIECLAINHINLMILDLNMPDMHGLDVLKFVRSHQKYQKIPIIVLTTKGDELSREAAMNAGATRYLTKPFEPRMFAKQAWELLN